MNQNSYSKTTCDNLAVDIDTNLGSPSCKETDESNQCQHVFLMMKNVHAWDDCWEIWIKYTTWASAQTLVRTKRFRNILINMRKVESEV